MSEPSIAGAHWSGDLSRRAVLRLKEALLAGTFDRLAAIDTSTGEIVDSEARALFSSLPAVTPATAPDEIMGQGLLRKIPRGLRDALETPRYRAGRPVFVRTTTSHESPDLDQPAGRFDPEGDTDFTHLARLVGRSESMFLVEVEDAPELQSFSQNDVFSWNEPSAFSPQGGTLSGVDVDYNDALLKAHICSTYLELADSIGELDFRATDEEVAAKQRQLIHRVASKVKCAFAGRGRGYRGARAGALLTQGEGVSFTQRALAVAFLQPFSRVLAFELQAAVGKTLRLATPHGFAVVTLRPSMHRFVCDPAWGEPLTELPVAFFGPGWGHDRMLQAFEGEQHVTVRPEDIDLPELGGITA